MLIHLDTSLLVDAFTGARRSMRVLRDATADGEVITFSTIVLYEWLRGPRAEHEKQAVDGFFVSEESAVFGRREAAHAAALYREVKGARQRQADLAIAACALEHGASLWTLNRADFEGVPGLTLYNR